MIPKKEILEIFKKYELEGVITIKEISSKEIEYNYLYDELSYDSKNILETNITIIKESRKAKAKIDSFSVDDIEDCIKKLLPILPYSEQDQDIYLPEIKDSTSIDFTNKKLDSIGFEELEEEYNNIKNYNFGENIKTDSISLGIKQINSRFINTLGADKSQKTNYFFSSVVMIGENGEKKEEDYVSVSSKNFIKIKKENYIGDKLELLNSKLEDSKKTIKSGKYTVTLDKELVEAFLDILLDSINAERIREKTSFITGKNIGDKLISEKISIINKPDLEDGIGNLAYDSEGITQKETVIFEKGVFKNKIYDSKNAKKDNIKDVSNTTISNIIIKGETSKDYLKNSKFLFTNLMAFHTVDETTGKFALSGEGYIIEDGEKVAYKKEVSLIGDILTMFSSIDSLGDDTNKYSNVYTPSITFNNLEISS